MFWCPSFLPCGPCLSLGTLFDVRVLFAQEFQDRMLQSVAQIGDAVDPLAHAAKEVPENIGHRVSKVDTSREIKIEKKNSISKS